MEEVKLPTRGSLIDKGEQPVFRLSGDDAQRTVKKHVFTHEDDENIGPKRRVTLMTCSMKNYPYIRHWLTGQFNAFVSLVNTRQVSPEEMVLNEDNGSMVSILNNDSHEDDVFIIPLQKLKKGMFPVGGVRFVTRGFISRGNRHNGDLKLIRGTTRINEYSRMLDYYNADESQMIQDEQVVITFGG